MSVTLRHTKTAGETRRVGARRLARLMGVIVAIIGAAVTGAHHSVMSGSSELGQAAGSPERGAGFDADAAMRWAERLASIEMRGRRTGTPDGDLAAKLVADEFRAAGLEAAGDDAGTYPQSFTFPFYQIVAPARLAWRRPIPLLDPAPAVSSGEGAALSAPSSDSWTPITQTDWQDLTYARDYYFLTGSGASSGEGEVAFAGYGLDVDARRDYARLNVKDRIVLAFEGAPTGLDLQPTQRSTFTKARTAKERGARGLLLVQTALEAPLPRDRIWVLRPENLLEGFMLGRVSPGVAGVLAGMEPAALRQRADDPGAAGAMRAAEIAWRVSVVFDPARAGANVLGRLIGRDAALRDQVVIVGAHYDGGGVDPDGTVYPGAEDNASGISIVLTLARTLAAAPRSARTIVLAGWGAEEQGAWGSRHYVDSHPQLGRVAATFTLDNAGMGDGAFRLYGATNFPEEWAVIRPTIPPDLRASFDPRGAGGSDGWTFQIRGIPSFFAHAAAPQPYVHTPGDTPSTLTRVSLDHAGGFMAAAVLAAANAPASFVESRRLDRYLARHGFIVGYTRAERPDWAALRRRGFDLVIWERPTAEAAASPEASNGIVMVKGRNDLADTEEGRPLRVLVAQSDGATLAFRESGASWRRMRDGWQAGGMTVQLVSAPASATASLDAGVAFVLDADAQLRVDEITGALLRVGQTVDEIEALVGGRVRDALYRAMR